jgi:PAS domain S-box-containing protein
METSADSRVINYSAAARYGVAVLAAAAAFLLREILSPWLGTSLPYHTMWVAVVFAAWYCGVGPAIVAMLLGSVSVWYWLLPPFRSFYLQDPKSQVTGLIVFWALSGVLIALGESNRRTKERLGKSEFRLRRLIDSNIIPIVYANMEGITEANDAFLKMVDYSRKDLAKSPGIDWVKLTPPEHSSKDAEALEQLKKEGFCTPYEKEYVRKDGSRVPFLIGATVVNTAPLEWLCFIVDLTDLKRVEAELRIAHGELEQKVEQRTKELAETVATLNSEIRVRRTTEEQLRGLSARLLRLQDEERRHIARDLHDSTGQTLTALKISLSSLGTLIANLHNIPKIFEDLNVLADQAFQEIRTTSHLLHPPMLDEVGFSSAARWYVDGFAERSGIKVKLDLDAVARLPQEAELVFFRVLQECLTNVLRHSGSKVVEIRLDSDQKNSILTVKDYGKGIPAEKLKSFHETGAGVGVGLGGMKQRLRELGGHLTVESDGTGTCVRAVLPQAKMAEFSYGQIRGTNHEPAA